MKIATWNVNGVRARAEELRAWLERERPDVVCLQELKARPDQVPQHLAEHPDYHGFWHGAGPYSGVALLFRKERYGGGTGVFHPPFDFETRIVAATVEGITVASVYVPNGGKDFGAKMRFLEELERFVAACHGRGERLLLLGDMNVTRADIDVHPKERKPDAIGQRPEERELFGRLLAKGLVDVGRALDPDNDALFTWWPPWRKMRERNIGWRLDYVLASEAMASGARACRVQRDVGSSDHAPVVAEIG